MISTDTVIAERWGLPDSKILSLHGWGRSHSDFKPSLGDLDTTSVDLPGFGNSPAPDVPWSSRQYAEAVAPLLTAGSPKVLVGHSFGGRVAVHLAQMFPDDVRGLVLTGAPLARVTPPRKPSWSVRLAKALHARKLMSDARMEALRDKHGSADYRAAQGVMRDILVKVLHEDYTEQLAAVAAPTRLVWGEHDTAASVEVAHKIAELIDGAQLTVVPGEAHPLSGAMGDHIRVAVQQLMD